MTANVCYCAIARTRDEKGFRIKAFYHESSSHQNAGNNSKEKEAFFEELLFEEISKQCLSVYNPEHESRVSKKLNSTLSYYSHESKGWAYIIIIRSNENELNPFAPVLNLNDKEKEALAYECIDELSRACKNLNYHIHTTTAIHSRNKNLKEARRLKRNDLCTSIALKYSTLMQGRQHEEYQDLLAPPPAGQKVNIHDDDTLLGNRTLGSDVNSVRSTTHHNGDDDVIGGEEQIEGRLPAVGVPATTMPTDTINEGDNHQEYPNETILHPITLPRAQTPQRPAEKMKESPSPNSITKWDDHYYYNQQQLEQEEDNIRREENIKDDITKPLLGIIKQHTEENKETEKEEVESKMERELQLERTPRRDNCQHSIFAVLTDSLLMAPTIPLIELEPPDHHGIVSTTSQNDDYERDIEETHSRHHFNHGNIAIDDDVGNNKNTMDNYYDDEIWPSDEEEDIIGRIPFYNEEEEI